MNKHSRRISSEDHWRHHNSKFYQFHGSSFLTGHIQIILTSILLLVSLALLFAIFSQLQAPNASSPPPDVTAMSYNEFISQVKANNVLSVTIQGDQITGNLAHSLKGNSCVAQALNPNDPYGILTPFAPADSSCTLFTYLPSHAEFKLLPLLQSHKVEVITRPSDNSSFWQILPWLSLLIIPILILLMIYRFKKSDKVSFDTMDKNVSKFLKSRVKRFNRTQPQQQNHASIITHEKSDTHLQVDRPSVTFSDVAGINEVRAELEEIVQFLGNPGKYVQLGAHVPRGVLLVGPPGTGKTLLAKAVAGEANVPFFYMSASEFIEMFVGVGASRVRDLFKQARASAPCVIFLDEIDAVGRKRSIHMTDRGERDQTLNQLLVELDGFNSRDSVIVLAATNRVDILDPALLRPGRFDRQITVSLPDRRGREAILKVHTRNTPLHADVQLDRLARLTTGMSGADLANLVNEAALYAARHGFTSLTQQCFEESLARIQLGAQRPLIMSEADRRVIAFHESGHALVAHYIPEAEAVNSITILPRGQHLGVTQFASEEDCYNYSREVLMARIAVGMGGRIAEELTFGSEGVTTGAENDLQSVTALAWRMVTHWGMGKRVGAIFADYCESNGASLPYAKFAQRFIGSPTMTTMIDHEVQCILEEGRVTALELLTDHHTQLTKLAQALLEHEQLNRTEFEALLDDSDCVKM